MKLHYICNSINKMNDKLIFRLILTLSAVVFSVVAYLYSLPKAGTIPEYAKQLPLFNACINATCSILLLLSFAMIKQKKVRIHKTLNLITFLLSACFLISYILFHSYGVETKYPADAPFRSFYLFILLSHILLAAVVLPLVLITFYYGLKNNTAKHRKIARWSFPVWLYVTVTGVIVYLMISPYYTF